MSFILKALKKVEEEKAARAASQVDLGKVILHGDRPARKRKILLPSVITLLFLTGVGAAWFAGRAKEPPLPSGSERPVQAQVTPAPLPVSPAPAVPVPPAAAAVEAKVAAATTTQAPPPPPPEKPVQRKRERPVIAGASVPPPAGLVLNGIAAQDDPAESVAIVNGVMLKKGMSIQGVKVERIKPEKVTFSGNGGIFELQLPR